MAPKKVHGQLADDVADMNGNGSWDAVEGCQALQGSMGQDSGQDSGVNGCMDAGCMVGPENGKKAVKGGDWPMNGFMNGKNGIAGVDAVCIQGQGHGVGWVSMPNGLIGMDRLLSRAGLAPDINAVARANHCFVNSPYNSNGFIAKPPPGGTTANEG